MRFLFICIIWCLSISAVWANQPVVQINAPGLSSRAIGVVRTSVETVAVLANDVDGGETARIRRQAREAAIEALATLGYFMPEVELTTIPGDTTTWQFTIQANQPTTVQSVTFDVYGGLTESVFNERLESLKQSWRLGVGKTFTNDDWESAKRAIVTDLQTNGFPAVRWITTLADVDGPSSQANLVLILDSGPFIRLGELKIEGLKRVPEGLIERYVNYSVGSPYLTIKLTEWQQQLQESAFFRGVRVELDLDEVEKMRANPDFDPRYQVPEMTVPLVVAVNESRAKRASIVLGVDSDVGARIEGVYRQNVVRDYPVELETGAHIDSKKRFGFVDLHFPPNASSAKYSTGILAQDSDIEGLYTRQVALGLVRTQIRHSDDRAVDYETRLGARISNERTEVENDPIPAFTTNTMTATWDWTRRAVNNNFDPRSGTLYGLGVGVGTEFSGSNQFVRFTARAQRWWPVGASDVVTVRAEAGQLFARQSYRVPQDFLFRTGGARTVRGYRFLSLGRPVGDAVLGDRSMFVASAEYTHYMSELVGIATFIDTGNVANSFGDLSLATGIGVGARVRTPAGPIQLDTAYGVDDKRLRIHFSLGIAM